MFFSRPLLERNYMHGSILIKNISFSRSCDIKTTKCKEHHRRFYLGKVYSKNSNTLEIEHSLLNSPIIIPRYGFHFRSTDLPNKPHSNDSGSLCKQTANTLLR